MRPSPNGFWLPVCIAKVTIPGHWVASLPRLAFEGLELCDGKLSRTVLRGLGAGNSPRLPGVFSNSRFISVNLNFACDTKIMKITWKKHDMVIMT